MKSVITLATLLLTLNSYASETINCFNPSDPGLTYVLNSVDYDHYNLKVTQKVLVPQSCRSRWGCDDEENVIYTDKLIMSDYQGAMVFESKRTYINMEDFDSVEFSYTTKGQNGKFQLNLVTLKCNY